MSGDGHVAVLGAGSWGTALAILLARKGIDTRLWGRNPEYLADLASERCNNRYLPGIVFPRALSVLVDLAAAVSGARDILLAVPSEGFRALLRQLKPMIGPDARIMWASKGLEPGSGKLLHHLVAEELGGQRAMAVLSGPTFAREVAAGLPTALTVAASDERYAEHVARLLHSEAFRAYTSQDMTGVELGGAVKNVLAIATGIADGMGLGANTRAALITRGLAEIQRLGVKLGGHPETFMGLAGLGDLVLTCTDDQSRNRRVGMALARGKSLRQVLEELGQVAEGVNNAKEVRDLARRHRVEMPIVEQVYQVLYQNKRPKQAALDLLGRELKPEYEGCAEKGG